MYAKSKLIDVCFSQRNKTFWTFVFISNLYFKLHQNKKNSLWGFSIEKFTNILLIFLLSVSNLIKMHQNFYLFFYLVNCYSNFMLWICYLFVVLKEKILIYFAYFLYVFAKKSSWPFKGLYEKFIGANKYAAILLCIAYEIWQLMLNNKKLTVQGEWFLSSSNKRNK